MALVAYGAGRAFPTSRPVRLRAASTLKARGVDSAKIERMSSLEERARWPGGWQPVPYAERCARRKVELAAGLERFLTYCRTRDDIAAVYVFGSYARDAVSPWSDIDVLVVRDAPADATRLELVEDLYRDGHLGGDIVAVPTARYPDGLRATPFGRTLLAEGVCMHARPAR